MKSKEGGSPLCLRKKTTRSSKVIVESDLSPKLELLFEKLDGLEGRMVEPSEMDELRDKLDVLESVVRTYSRDIAVLKKAQ